VPARWNKVIVPASLHNVGDRPAIDLQMERQIPSKIWSSQNNKTPTRLSGADRGYAKKYENEKEWSGQGESWLHRLMLGSRLVFGERGVR
jgi:hypothetical protein